MDKKQHIATILIIIAIASAFVFFENLHPLTPMPEQQSITYHVGDHISTFYTSYGATYYTFLGFSQNQGLTSYNANFQSEANSIYSHPIYGGGSTQDFVTTSWTLGSSSILTLDNSMFEVVSYNLSTQTITLKLEP